MDAGETDAEHWAQVEDAVETLHEQQPFEAIVALRRVIKEHPRNPYAFHWLGVCLFETGELDAARDAYRAALTLSPTYLGARVHLSHVLRMLGDSKSALEQAETARRQAPSDPEVWHALGLAHAQRGDRDQALQYLEAYLGSNPEFEVGLEVRAIVQRLSGGSPQRSTDVD